MIFTNLARPLYRVLKKGLKKAAAATNSIKYRHLTPRYKSSYEYVANLLLVKQPIYAQLARVCVESFLYFNPKCKIVIHVDSVTESIVSRTLKKISVNKGIEIRNVGGEDKSWQEIKLRIILEMKNPNEFFMDADLRWNGPIPQLIGTTFFVNEFKLKDDPVYLKLLEFSRWESEYEFTMKNTSFIYWGDYKPAYGDKIFIDKAMKTVQEACIKGIIPQENQSAIMRISEQIALSILVDVKHLNVNFLKEIDGYRDGSFVESSYFGATGSSF